MTNKLTLIFLTILLIRFLLVFIPGFQIDISAWQAWSQRIVELGPGSFYSDQVYTLYFPGYLYILWPFGEIFKLIFPDIPFQSLPFEVILKSLNTFFDLGSAFLIFKIIHNKFKIAKSIAIFYFANPALIFNTSVWGQIDGILILFLLLCSYYLSENKNLISSIPFSFALLLKPQALAFFPLVIFKNPKIMFVIPVIFLLLSLPFFPNDPLGILKLTQKLEGQYPFTSLFAFNFWSLVGWWKQDSFEVILSYKNWGYILYFAAMFFILIPALLRKRLETKEFFLLSSLSFLSFFLFLTRIHERYLLPVLPFILIAAALYKSRLLFYMYGLISLIHLVNLWYVYYHYNLLIFGKDDNFFYKLIDNNYRILSATLLLIFFLLVIFNYKTYGKKT